MEIGYARVSTQEQNLDLQIDALNKEGVKKIFTDKVSGIKNQKPQLEELLNYVRQGDTIVVWRLDRLGRTTVQLIQFVEELKVLGVNLKSLTEPIDTSTATGTLVVQIFCVLAEHERNVLRERTRAGLNSARVRGRTGGRPKGLSPKYEQMKALIKDAYEKQEHTTNEIMLAFKIKSRGTFYRILTSAGANISSFTKRKK
jgi:DNA invertase Pin-like site-specific DNA recombinase